MILKDILPPHFYQVTRLLNFHHNIVVDSAATQVFKNLLDKQILGLFYVGLILFWQWAIWDHECPYKHNNGSPIVSIVLKSTQNAYF